MKLAEEALREKEARVREALTAAGLAVWDLRLPEWRLYWEPGAGGLFGLKELEPEEPLEAFLKRVNPEDLPKLAERLARCAGLIGEVEVEYRVKAPDGTERRHALRARASPDGPGRGRMLGVVVDLAGPLANAGAAGAA
jgi:PAS domain-containing protein